MNKFRLVSIYLELPRVTVTEEFKAVTIGSDIALKCIVTETYPPIKMTWWEKHGINVTGQIDSQNKTVDLKISQVDSGDLGEYSCCARNIKGTNCSSKILLGGKSILFSFSCFFFFFFSLLVFISRIQMS